MGLKNAISEKYGARELCTAANTEDLSPHCKIGGRGPEIRGILAIWFPTGLLKTQRPRNWGAARTSRRDEYVAVNQPCKLGW